MKRFAFVLLLCAAGCLMPQPSPVPVNPVNPPAPVGPVDPNGPQAWVVTEQLPDTGPPRPDPTPFNPQVEPEPEPYQPPSAVCSCGCGRVNCTCAKNSQHGCTATSDAPPRKPVLIVNDSALEFANAQVGADPVIAYAPPWCRGPCADWERLLGAGDATIRIEWRHEEIPPEIAKQSGTAPSLTYRGKVLWQSPVGQTLATIKSRVREMQGTQAAIVAAVNVGTIQGRAAVATLLQAVTKQRTGESLLVFGSSSVILPPKMRCALEMSPESVRVTFDGPKPMVRYGSGILSVSRPITFIGANRDTMTIGVDGFPDLSFRLE